MYFVIIIGCIFISFHNSLASINPNLIPTRLLISYVREEYGNASGNLTNGTVNLHVRIYKEPPPNIFVTITLLKANERGVYSLLNSRPAVKQNFCNYIKHDPVLYPTLVKSGNLPTTCPIKKDDYYVRNYRVPAHLIPPLIPAGNYQMVFVLGMDEVVLAQILFQFQIIY